MSKVFILICCLFGLFYFGTSRLLVENRTNSLSETKAIKQLSIDSSLNSVLHEISVGVEKCNNYVNDSSFLFTVNVYQQEGFILFIVRLERFAIPEILSLEECFYGFKKINNNYFVFSGDINKPIGLNVFINALNKSKAFSFKMIDKFDVRINICGECNYEWHVAASNYRAIVVTEICIDGD